VPESYVHRIGRTARAGAEGKAISLVGDDERNLLRDIQRLTRQTIPSFDRRGDKHLAQAQAAEAHLGFDKPGEGEGLESRRGERTSERSGERSGERRPQPKPHGQAKPQTSSKQRQKFRGARRDGVQVRDEARPAEARRSGENRPAGRFGAPVSGYEPLKEAAAGEGVALKRKRRRRSNGRSGPTASAAS
jgi:ATP-dependent RNA helicase RhlE